MATLTKKDLLEAIEDMPDDTLICLSPNDIEYYVVENVECYKKSKNNNFMLTEKDYCDYKLIVELEQLGMPIKIDFACSIGNGQLVKTKFYPNPPSLYEAQKWLREVKRICVEVDCCAGGYVWELCKAYNKDWFSGGTTIYTEEDPNNPLLNDCGKYESYEEALSEGIKAAVKILKGE